MINFGEPQKAFREIKKLKADLAVLCSQLAITGDAESIEYAKTILNTCHILAVVLYQVSQRIPKKKGVKNG